MHSSRFSSSHQCRHLMEQYFECMLPLCNYGMVENAHELYIIHTVYARVKLILARSSEPQLLNINIHCNEAFKWSLGTQETRYTCRRKNSSQVLIWVRKRQSTLINRTEEAFTSGWSAYTRDQVHLSTEEEFTCGWSGYARDRVHMLGKVSTRSTIKQFKVVWQWYSLLPNIKGQLIIGVNTMNL